MPTDYGFDPWEGSDGREGKGKVKLAERTFPASLYNRALKRVKDVTRVGGREFVVQGNSRFGDSYSEYKVRWLSGDNYECDCATLLYGQTRVDRGCSHSLAVMIYRNRLRKGADETNGADGGNGVGESAEWPDLGQPSFSAGWNGQLRLITVPPVSDPSFMEWDDRPLPAKFTDLRPYQWVAIQEIMSMFDRGIDVVWLDAPTGTGKSLVAEVVRRMLKARAFYVCHSKTLQQQFLNDFGYARLLMGRGNYPTLDGPRDVTCEDCTKTDPMDSCMWCSDSSACPYQVAKWDAAAAKLSVINSAYFLTESNYVGQVNADRTLGIFDECDMMENELMGFIQFSLNKRMIDNLKIQVPKEGSHRTTIGRWFQEDLQPAVANYAKSIQGDDLRAIRDRMRAGRLYTNVLRICQQVEKDKGLESWVRDVNAGPMVLKPVTVHEWGNQYLWRHAKKWLCMSATVISTHELSTSTGVEPLRWDTVRVPMSFPVENRKIIVAPVADMSKRGKANGEWGTALTALRHLCDLHPDERILVHTVSYELAGFATQGLQGQVDRPVLTYRRSADREPMLRRFRRTPRAVLVASSLDRGVDLAEDDCRVVIVLKVPFPNLGDRQISERLRMPDGQAWYAVQTIRTLVQMTGRAVRSETDWCVSYILDRQMVRDSKGRGGVLKRQLHLLPTWWRDALVTDFPVNQLLEG